MEAIGWNQRTFFSSVNKTAAIYIYEITQTLNQIPAVCMLPRHRIAVSFVLWNSAHKRIFADRKRGRFYPQNKMYIQGRTFNFWVHLSSCALPDFVYTDSGMCLCVCVDQRWDASLSRMFWGGQGLDPPTSAFTSGSFFQSLTPPVSQTCTLTYKGFLWHSVCVRAHVCVFVKNGQ